MTTVKLGKIKYRAIYRRKHGRRNVGRKLKLVRIKEKK